jgi:adenylosuccinate synthase
MKKTATLICDLQFGSTGKGLIAGYIAERDEPDVVMTTWGANAGHTYIDREGRKYTHTMIANGCVSPKLKFIVIGPGSSLNLDNLFKEAATIDWPESFVGIIIHPQAGVINTDHEHRESEGSMVSIGSTRKGVGECVIDKIRRDPEGKATAFSYRDNILMRSSQHKEFSIGVVTDAEYRHVWTGAERILIEGAQGFSLGINSGFYPYVTSRECTPAQILSDLCLPIGILNKVIGCARTYPIRVANRYDENNLEVGNSGPCYDDQIELKWGDIGVKPELTTVTKLPRRVFNFSLQQMRDAFTVCQPDEVFLNFVNYMTELEAKILHREIRQCADVANCDTRIRYMGFGPTANDIADVRVMSLPQFESKEKYRDSK